MTTEELIAAEAAILVLPIIWILVCVRHRKSGVCEITEALDKKQTDALKGFLAIIVILGHVVSAFPSMEPLRLLDKSGVLCCAVFFVFSGYALALSYANKPNYLKGFFRKKIVTLVLPIIVAYYIYYVIFLVAGIDLGLDYLFAKDIWNTTNWFMKSLILLYCFFWISRKWGREASNHLLLAFTLSAMLLGYFSNVDRLLYGSTLCFPLGAYIYDCGNQFNRLLELRITPILLFLIGGASGLYSLSLGYYDFLGDFILRNVAAICVALFAIWLLQRIRLKETRVSQWLGTRSYHLYLYQFMALRLFVDLGLVSHPILYLLAVLALTFCLAEVGWRIDKGFNLVFRPNKSN